MKVLLRNPRRELEISGRRSVHALLHELGLPREAHLVICNGTLVPGDQIVLVVTLGAHRGEAFAACEFIMDFLKTRAPFWKKERTPEGERWVEAKAADDAAAERWK